MKLTLLSISIVFSFFVFGQYKTETENLQYKRVNSILSKLKENKIQDLSSFFSQDCFNEKKLNMVSKEILKVYRNSFESIVLVYDGDNHIWRCRYVVNEISVYQVDLIFGNKLNDNVVMKISTKNKDVLLKEYNERMNNNSEPPPPPPAPN
jgi:hypothetical protein